MTISTSPHLDHDNVGVVAVDLAAAVSPWKLADGASPDERQYALLASTDVYDAWLIYWPPGTGLEPHDHGGSSGAFAVVTGTLDEDKILDGGTVTTRVGPGESVTFDGSARSRRQQSQRRPGDECARVLATAAGDGLLPSGR